MSFGQAKALDMAWNWVAGRGVQVILAWLAYHVFTGTLMRTAEMAYLPYELFTALALHPTSPSTIWDLCKGLFDVPGWRVKFSFVWLIWSILYLATFPSLLDVMSGYETSVRTELRLPNGTNALDITGMSDFEGVLSIRLGCFIPDGTGLKEGLTPSGFPRTKFCRYDFFDQTLNESYAAYQANIELSSNRKWPGGQLYTMDPRNYNCFTEPDVYQWGFSGEWVLIVACVNGLWLLGLWIIWLDAERCSRLCRQGRRMGTYRAIVDLADAIKEELGGNLGACSNKELEKALRKRGPVKYFVEEGKGEEADGPGRIGLSSRGSKRVTVQLGRKYG